MEWICLTFNWITANFIGEKKCATKVYPKFLRVDGLQCLADSISVVITEFAQKNVHFGGNFFSTT